MEKGAQHTLQASKYLFSKQYLTSTSQDDDSIKGFLSTQIYGNHKLLKNLQCGTFLHHRKLKNKEMMQKKESLK